MHLIFFPNHIAGEMIVGPIKALFMDEISTGLDSSTTFQIVTCLQQLVHITDATAVLSLLQPAPETFELFDDLILMAEGKIVYHGPCSQAIQFFRDCGFWCPERKGVADFLQEVGMETVSLTFVEYSRRMSLSQKFK
jgi:ABC-type multidrug transport system ATPase subunit